MNLTDWIGAIGVGILLLAYWLNINKQISETTIGYSLLNIVGAGLACLASVLLRYWPFILLEAAWMMASIFSLYKNYRLNYVRNN
jgi:hypothetical protein